MHKYRVYPDGEIVWEDEFSERDPKYDDYFEGEVHPALEEWLHVDGRDYALKGALRDIKNRPLAVPEKGKVFSQGRLRGLLEAQDTLLKRMS